MNSECLKTLPVATLLFMSSAFGGCSGSTQSLAPQTLQNAQKSFDEGEKAFLAKDYATAEAKLAQSLTGGLPADVLVQAYLYRGLALGYLGRKEEALAEIEKASGGAGDIELKKAKAAILKANGGDKSRPTAKLQ